MRLRDFLFETAGAKAGILPYFIEADDSISYLFMTSSDPDFGGPDPMVSKGHVDIGESVEQAAVREGKEELGLRVSNIVANSLKEGWVGELGGMTSHYKMHIYTCQVKDKTSFDEPHYETKETNWFSFEEAMRKVRRSHRDIVKSIHEKLQKQ